VAAVLGLAVSARAEPLNLKQVAADAKWVAQVDVDAAHASVVLKNARQQFLKQHPQAEVILAGIRAVWKFDPLTDLHGLTFYGAKLKKDTGVVLVHAKLDQNLLLEKANAAVDHQAAAYGKYELHTWTHAKGTKHQRSMTGAFYGPDILIFGASIDEVKAALDVLDGTKPSLATADQTVANPLAAAPPPGAILVARAIGIAEADLPHKHPLAKQIESLSLAVGERQGESCFDAKLTLKQPELAQQVKAVVEGVRAIAMIVHGDDDEAVKLLGPLKVAAEGNVLSLEWRAPAETVWAHAQKMCEKMKARMERRPHAWPHHPAEEK
jgi:hypothetical protein